MVVAQVASDNREVGRLQARLFRALLPAGGTVVSVEGPGLSAAVSDRRDGLREGLVGSRVSIVKTLTADWSGEGAERAMSFWLRLGSRGARPALVGAQNDLMAAGARKAVLALRPEWRDVLFTGVDGLPEGGQRQVREKALVATVVQPLTAGVGIELVARWLRGEKVPPTQLVAPRTYPSLEENRAPGPDVLSIEEPIDSRAPSARDPPAYRADAACRSRTSRYTRTASAPKQQKTARSGAPGASSPRQTSATAISVAVSRGKE